MRSYAHPIYITEIHSNPSLCTILLFLMSLDLFLFAKGHVKIYIGFLFTSQFASLIIPFIYTNQCTSTKSFQFFSSFQVFLASHQHYYILGKENKNISKNIINLQQAYQVLKIVRELWAGNWKYKKFLSLAHWWCLCLMGQKINLLITEHIIAIYWRNGE